MSAKRHNRTTIVIAPEIRDGLKHIARKDQTYNQLLSDLIKEHETHIKFEIEKAQPVQEGKEDQTNPLTNPIAQTQSSSSYHRPGQQTTGVKERL